MNSILAVFSAFALAYLGMTGLALAMDRHHRQMFPGRHLPSTRVRYAIRFTSWGLLGLSAWACAHAWGTAVGAVAWFGVLMVVALLLVCLQPYAPRWIRWGAAAAVLILLGVAETVAGVVR
ncbi:MAG: DUF3325 domain-containing protein [Azonexus sp.]|nr:DUF3325 domain-containing protein [Azonexus sp.]